ncbi:hypothetical protein SAMN05216275_10640 [Streptosporangium canum]|uniref:Uncharacterized protein n=1 Tax=Streptosporangium canum TaxID=324952 RepID=A0A1I3MWN9_9ACTN|nr:hypothetical protein [Streptosporangium canum]SFJ01544.1 hypothetical protein SAMN05216275_10640 [Streptosporangium canum]
MNDRHEDRLVHKNDDDELNVPPQRADGVTPGFQEPRPAGTFPDRHDGPAGDLGNDLDGDRLREPGEGRPDDWRDDRSGALGQDTPVDVTGRHNVHDGVHDGAHDSARDDLLDDDTPTVIADRPGDVLDRDRTGTRSDRPGLAHGPLFDQDAEQVRRRWQEVQASFVDDPRDSVERADSLVGEITTALRTALETRTAELQGRWKNGDQSDTEQLRTALRDYRAMLEQLLDLADGTR